MRGDVQHEDSFNLIDVNKTAAPIADGLAQERETSHHTRTARKGRAEEPSVKMGKGKTRAKRPTNLRELD